MKTFTLKSQFCFPIHSNLKNQTKTPKSTIPITKRPYLSLKNRIPTSQITPKSPLFLEKINPRISHKFIKKTLIPDGYSRYVILGAVSAGFVLFFMGIDDGQKALALGFPEGPLVEEFWDNMRRYGLYILTVSTGVLYAIFEPIVELLKNPISAILILVIVVGGFYIVSNVVSAMVGITDFSYEYNY